MPVYSTSLGCLSAPYVYNGGKTSVSIPAGSRYDHAIDVHGGSPGTIFIAEGSVDATEIQYDILIRSNDESLLSQISLIYPMESEVENSRFLLSTPLAAEDKCLRFDIVMRIPPTLKKLHVASVCVHRNELTEYSPLYSTPLPTSNSILSPSSPWMTSLSPCTTQQQTT